MGLRVCVFYKEPLVQRMLPVRGPRSAGLHLLSSCPLWDLSGPGRRRALNSSKYRQPVAFVLFPPTRASPHHTYLFQAVLWLPTGQTLSGSLGPSTSCLSLLL